MAETVPRLLAWFERSARSLPWRSEPRDPYRVLVSELMLQQTQVDRVVPRFDEFIARFPNLESLARASQDEVLGSWSGLGYYRRARMLHRLAVQVEADSGGLPSSSAELQELPGVGPYTAAAVASLAFGEAVPVLDGNVMRVASRVLAFGGDPRSAEGRSRLMPWLSRLVAVGPPGQVNEALMELGATICVPSNPDCESCPLSTRCEARSEGRPEAYPQPRKGRPTIRLQWVAACCLDHRGHWLVRRVVDGPILRGLWLPPIAVLTAGADPVEAARSVVSGLPARPPDLLPEVEHSITHRRIQVVPVRWKVSRERKTADGDRWVRPGSDDIPTSSLFHKLIITSDLHDDV